MSIYSTMWEIAFEVVQDPQRNQYQMGEKFIKITAQGVPSHIGSKEEDPDGDPYPWLPPPVEDETYERAVVIIGPDHRKGTERSGQEYVDPLMTVSGEKYHDYSFSDLLYEIVYALKERGWSLRT